LIEALGTVQKELTKDQKPLQELEPCSLLNDARKVLLFIHCTPPSSLLSLCSYSISPCHKDLEKKDEDAKKNKKKSKWMTSLDETFQIKFSEAKAFPHDEITKVQPWKDLNIKGIQRSEGGSEVHTIYLL
jgi:hypothetical protein